MSDRFNGPLARRISIAYNIMVLSPEQKRCRDAARRHGCCWKWYMAVVCVSRVIAPGDCLPDRFVECVSRERQPTTAARLRASSHHVADRDRPSGRHQDA